MFEEHNADSDVPIVPKRVNKSRRLRHFRDTFRLIISGSGTPETEDVIYGLASEYIGIDRKWLAKGHTKNTEIKAIELKVMITWREKYFVVDLDVHVKHYSKVYFDLYPFIAKLNSRLKLPPTSVRLASDLEKERNATKQVPVPVPEPEPEPIPVPVPEPKPQIKKRSFIVRDSDTQ